MGFRLRFLEEEDIRKIKLRGNDAEWDYERTVKIGELASAEG